MNCCMCKKTIEKGQNHSDYSFYGNFRIVCEDCRNALNNLSAVRKDKKLAGKQYINNLLASNQYEPDINCELKWAIGMQISAEERTAAKDYLKELREEKNERTRAAHQEQEEKKKKQLNGTGFTVAGTIFLILAIFLDILSVRPLDSNAAALLGTTAVINIQSAIFSAASYVASVVCFACKGLVRYFKR